MRRLSQAKIKIPLEFLLQHVNFYIQIPSATVPDLLLCTDPPKDLLEI